MTPKQVKRPTTSTCKTLEVEEPISRPSDQGNTIGITSSLAVSTSQGMTTNKDHMINTWKKNIIQVNVCLQKKKKKKRPNARRKEGIT